MEEEVEAYHVPSAEGRGNVLEQDSMSTHLTLSDLKTPDTWASRLHYVTWAPGSAHNGTGGGEKTRQELLSIFLVSFYI